MNEGLRGDLHAATSRSGTGTPGAPRSRHGGADGPVNDTAGIPDVRLLPDGRAAWRVPTDSDVGKLQWLTRLSLIAAAAGVSAVRTSTALEALRQWGYVVHPGRGVWLVADQATVTVPAPRPRSDRLPRGWSWGVCDRCGRAVPVSPVDRCCAGCGGAR